MRILLQVGPCWLPPVPTSYLDGVLRRYSVGVKLVVEPNERKARWPKTDSGTKTFIGNGTAIRNVMLREGMRM